KLPSERSEYIIPFLKRLRRDYGEPIACVHDMGTGILKAVAAVFPNSRDFICHFHFLRDVGKDLIEPCYSKLRSCLRTHAATTKFSALVRQVRQQLEPHSIGAQQLAKLIQRAEPLSDMALLPLVSTYSLALWCLQGKQNGDGYGFPFDRPLLEFAQRLLILIEYLPDLVQRLPAKDRTGNRIFYKLVRQVIDVVQDPVFEPAVEELRWRCRLFDDLREKMRIALPDGDKGLNDEGSSQAMDNIKKGVGQFRRRLDTNTKFADDPLCRKVAKQIDQYGAKLFTDPIEINTPTGAATIYPQRTNNILEQFFRRQRREYRRRTGNNSMRKRLQTMLADTPLVKNLSNPDYVDILLHGNSTLEELFAEIEMNGEKCDTKSVPDTERLLPGFRPLSNLPSLPEQIVRLATTG
ncbi:transposase, partial [Desulfosarcina cetonica]